MPIGKLGRRRHVVIPQEICDEVGLKEGDFVEVQAVRGRVIINNWLRVFRSATASRSGHRRRQQRHTGVMWSEKCRGLRGTA